MIAIDTNVLVRFLIGDDPLQSPRAKALFESQDIFVSTTVLLETEWVLRSALNLVPAQICDRFEAVAGMPGVSVESPPRLAKALDWTRKGMDFADALHLAGSEDCTGFATFDRGLIKLAAPLSGIELHLP